MLVGTTAGLLRAAGTRQCLSGWGPSICLWLQVGPEEGTLKPASLLSPQLLGAAAQAHLPSSPVTTVEALFCTGSSVRRSPSPFACVTSQDFFSFASPPSHFPGGCGVPPDPLPAPWVATGLASSPGFCRWARETPSSVWISMLPDSQASGSWVNSLQCLSWDLSPSLGHPRGRAWVCRRDSSPFPLL